MTTFLLYRLCCAVLLLCAVAVPCSAQFFVQCSAGYSFGFPSQHWGRQYSDATDEIHGIYGALAEGFAFDLGVSYMVDRVFGFALDGSVLLGTQIDGYSAIGEPSSQFSASMLSIIPSVVVALPVARTADVYTKAGLCIVVPTVTIRYFGDGGIIVDGGVHRDEYEGGTGMGMRVVLGIRTVSDETTLFLETALTQVAWSAEERNGTALTIAPRYNLGSIAVRAGVLFAL